LHLKTWRESRFCSCKNRTKWRRGRYFELRDRKLHQMEVWRIIKFRSYRWTLLANYENYRSNETPHFIRSYQKVQQRSYSQDKNGKELHTKRDPSGVCNQNFWHLDTLEYHKGDWCNERFLSTLWLIKNLNNHLPFETWRI
jgi:hypothetical protein